jgi:large subunit ribosomal protein L25
MAKTLVLKAEIRGQRGTKSAVKVREEGRIPAIVYGHKREAVAVSVDAHDLVEGLHHGHRLFDVQIDRKPEKVIVKDLQYDHLGRKIIHADFMRVDVTEEIRIEVPIELKGTAKGAHEGGIIEEHVDHLEVECRVTEIPESIVVSVKDVGLGDAIHAADIELPEGVKLVSSPETLIVTCHQVAVAKTTEELEQEMPVAPEVIGEAEKEQEPTEQQESKR